MPADFPNDVRTTLTAINSTADGATTFAANVTTLLNRVFGSTNPFGTAATRDTGTGSGNVPVLDSTGKLPNAVLPPATASGAGVLELATSLDDTGTNVVPTAAQVDAELTRIGGDGVLNINDFSVSDMTAATPFVTTGGGLIIASGAGGAADAGRLTITYGSGTVAQRQSLTVHEGGDTAGVAINSTLTAANDSTPLFAITLPGKGAVSASGSDATLLLALVGATGGTFRVTGGTQLTGNGASFAFYLQVTS